MGELLSITECALHHGLTRAGIHAAIKRGALGAQRVGHMWVVTVLNGLRLRAPGLQPHVCLLGGGGIP
jgi:hypothetical protein